MCFEFEGQLYDASGLVRENLDVYRQAKAEDIEIIKNRFGKRVEGLLLYENVTAKLRELGTTKEEIVDFLIREAIKKVEKVQR